MPDGAPADIIHALMIRTYKEILTQLTQKYPSRIIVADVTSTLNPFVEANHVYQIEPSGVGGKVIANLLKHIISCGEEARGLCYSFNESGSKYQSTKIATGSPCTLINLIIKLTTIKQDRAI